MESSKLAIALIIAVTVLVAFADVGGAAAAAIEDVGAPAPAMENAGLALYAPSVLTAITSVIAWLV